VSWRYDPAVTETNLTRADLAHASQTSLKLIYRGNIFIVNQNRPVLLMGRDDSNDIVIVSLFASRVHARCRRTGISCSPTLSNGTFLLVDEHSSEVLLRREEACGRAGLDRRQERHQARRPLGSLHGPVRERLSRASREACRPRVARW
jgi:hypothetical protein